MSLPKAQVSHLHKGEVDSHLSRLSTPPYFISPPGFFQTARLGLVYPYRSINLPQEQLVCSSGHGC